MAGTQIPTVPLCGCSEELRIPFLGMGTLMFPIDPEKLKQAVLEAIEEGYRHFDTSPPFLSEEALGEAVMEAVEHGLIKSRDDVFITSKLWPCDASPELVEPALRRTLQDMGLERLDLYLMAWPLRLQPEKYGGLMDAAEVLPLDLPGVWAAMEECQRLGLTRAIGVCNFSCKKLEELLQIAKISPAVNQVEVNPIWRQRELRNYCEEKRIRLVSYASLGGQSFPFANNCVLVSKEIKRIAHDKGKTVAQISLRWLYEKGVCPIVKTLNRERMKENMQIFDWELTEEEINVIDHLKQRKAYPYDLFIVGDITPHVRDIIANDIM